MSIAAGGSTLELANVNIGRTDRPARFALFPAKFGQNYDPFGKNHLAAWRSHYLFFLFSEMLCKNAVEKKIMFLI